MNIRIAVSTFVLLLVLGNTGSADDTAKTADAQASGEQWFALIDKGECALSFDASSSAFKGLVKRRQWIRNCEDTRKHTGATVARKLASSIYTMSLPKMPTGEYVLLKFETRFQRYSRASELVIMVREKDEQWRVASYAVSWEYQM